MAPAPSKEWDLLMHLICNHISFPSGFFDGAEKNGRCGCGVVLYIDAVVSYRIHWYEGMGTNTRAELVALWGLLLFIAEKQVSVIHIYGDLKTIVDGFSDRSHFNLLELRYWRMCTSELLSIFQDYNIQQIFRESNSMVDLLSKHGLLDEEGYMLVSFLHGDAQGEDIFSLP